MADSEVSIHALWIFWFRLLDSKMKSKDKKTAEQ